ncbi:transporter substrate-binding domain-containing protein [Rouxiella badensis]|jgi:lysine/arginine/ornithine transport system substrate-binding protein|nr:transporter substrate-binding domain-containing protein [Rouxiella badensis]MCC3702056.1 transporter substrate-binding domain-containing protein [Rouxiella badensis]MCC3717050.1 transporter substrate-binding domain-containing protein [Rouxiella badensis]MCC3728158.1 transporter substrate-binding domain-containing protein [Rouxiella badensis]MCC3732062.1 transporter substrate-binding domain-containing protein [Rouxiella badensis]MCC3739902.1 transporter substrate-binding domain-containing pr
MNKMTKSMLTLALMGLTLSAGAAHAEETLRVAADLSYPPFQFRDAKGTPSGYEIDVTNAICKEMQVKCDYVVTSFDAEIPSLIAKKVDFISPQGATDKRRKVIDFSDFVYHIPTKLVVQKGSPLLPTAESLKGKRVAVQQGSIQEMYANAYWLPKGVDVVPYADQDTIYQDLTAGRLDAALSPAVAVTYGFLNKPQGKDFTLTGPEVRDDKLFSVGSSFGVRKGDDKTKALLDQGLAKIVADGTWDKIRVKYFGDLDIAVHQASGAK